MIHALLRVWTGRSPKPAPSPRRGFSLVELLVTLTIIFTLGAISSPVIAATFRDVRFANAMARTQAGFLRARLLLLDQMRGDIPSLTPPFTPTPFAGTALVFRFVQSKSEYDIFYAVHTPAAADASGKNLANLTPPLLGYARFGDLEPMTLGSGLRVAGVRRNNATANSGHLELVPNSFAVCINPLGVAIPPAQKIHVNFQEIPLGIATGPWNFWDTGDYDPATYGEDSGIGGEGFATSLPLVIIYHDDDLPHDEAGPNVYRNADGSLNTALDPNELIRVTKGRLVMLTIQGGNTVEF